MIPPESKQPEQKSDSILLIPLQCPTKVGESNITPSNGKYIVMLKEFAHWSYKLRNSTSNLDITSQQSFLYGCRYVVYIKDTNIGTLNEI